jgi:hypothetical protein
MRVEVSNNFPGRVDPGGYCAWRKVQGIEDSFAQFKAMRCEGCIVVQSDNVPFRIDCGGEGEDCTWKIAIVVNFSWLNAKPWDRPPKL